MNEIYLFKIKVAELHAIRTERSDDPEELVNILYAAQGLFGYLPPEVQQIIAVELNIPASRVYGAAIFYLFFTMISRGEYLISVCLGMACYACGTENVLEEMQRQLGIKIGEITLDGLLSLDCLHCVGVCGLAPVVMTGGKVYGRITSEKVRDILSDHYLKE